MTAFALAVASAAILCSLVTGFLLAFAVVVMPGIAKLDDRAFLRAFQMDGVIQRTQPVFALIWIGSVAAVTASVALALVDTRGVDLLCVLSAAAVYLIGVQLPTVRINIPLNNALQKLDMVNLNEASCTRARETFEGSWNRWNVRRTACSFLASVLMLIVVIRL